MAEAALQAESQLVEPSSSPSGEEQAAEPLFHIGQRPVSRKNVLDAVIIALWLLPVLIAFMVHPIGLDAPPVSSGWKTVLSFVPFIIVFQGILSFKLSSRYVAPFTLLVVVVLGMSFFLQDAPYFDYPDMTGSSAWGLVGLTVLDRALWTCLDYAINVFTAFFFLRVLQSWGVVERMREEFEAIAPNANRKIALVGFCFAIVLAVVAPGGSNFVIAGAILIKMNLLDLPDGSAEQAEANKSIGALCLFGNAITSAFNLMGVCIIALSEDISPLSEALPDPARARFSEEFQYLEYGEKEIGRLFSMLFFVNGVLAPILMVLVFRPEQGLAAKLATLKHDLLYLLGIGVVYAFAQIFVAWGLGPQLPCLLAGGLAMIAYIMMEKGRDMSFPKMSADRAYVLPFIFLMGSLMLIQLVPGVEDAMTGEGDPDGAGAVLNPHVLDVQYAEDLKFSRTFPWLVHPGLYVVLAAIMTPYVVRFKAPTDVTLAGAGAGDTPFADSKYTSKMRWKSAIGQTRLKLRALKVLEEENMNKNRSDTIKEAFKEAFLEVIPVLVSITSFASIAKLMGRFYMTQTIAQVIVSGLADAPAVYALIAPIIGMLGSGLTGSSTTSNFLFARLQVATAVNLDLVTPTRNSVWEMGAVQLYGATAGEIISPMNAVVITLMPGVGGVEADLIKRLIPVWGVWLLFNMLISFLFLVPPVFN